MSATLRLAAVQFELRPEPTFAGFLAHLADVVDEAARAGAELVVLPELVGTGLLASHPRAAELTRADMQATYRELYPELTDAYEAAVGELAVRKGLWLLAGSHYRRLDGDRFRNTAYLAHPDGRLESQDKLHLTPPEVVLGTDRGEEVLITTVGPARVGIQICMDIQFPEVTRYLALQGVDLVLCPSLTWNRRGAHRVRYSSISRALENQLYVATSISLGTCGVPNDGAIHGTGRALVSCPIDARFGIHDGLLAQAESDGEEIVVAELDFDRVRESRADPEPPGLKNLRPELYRSLISDVVAP